MSLFLFLTVVTIFSFLSRSEPCQIIFSSDTSFVISCVHFMPMKNISCLRFFHIDSAIKILDYISVEYVNCKCTYLEATYSNTEVFLSTTILFNDISIKTFPNRISIVLFVVASICLEITNERHRCNPSKHLFRSYIFYKEYLSYIVHLRGSIGTPMVNFEQNSTLFQQSWRKSSPWHTRWFISMCLFCFRLRTRRSFVLLWLLVLYVEEDAFLPY